MDSCNIHGNMQDTICMCMLNACCISSDIFVSIRIRPSHSISSNCFNMQFDRANRQVDFIFMLYLGMLKRMTEIRQCCKSSRDCMSFLKYSSSPTAPVADCLDLSMLCVEDTDQGFRNPDSAFTNFRILRGTL